MNHIEGLLNVSMDKIKSMVDVNTIVGDPVTTPDGTTVIPVSKVSFGFAAGGSEFSTKQTEEKAKNQNSPMFGGGAGSGVSINPIAFLVITKDQVRILPITNSVSTADRIIDSIPDLISKVNGFVMDFKNKDKSEPEIDVKEETEE
ncbi:MAG: sporulation protein YtfJ [Ruminococcaceae bacterium]|nr:sporulation protein YtfJ [Oscillospiraceae bacterium]